MSKPAQSDAQSYDQALVRLRQMFAKPEHPYYIMAPAYRETSSGIVSLHLLCHLLNLNGREAYLCGSTQVNTELKTPLCDATIYDRHRAEGKVPIAVYPEVTCGNPLNQPVVARYLLNRESFISGRGMDARASDLRFHYSAQLAKDNGFGEVDLLCLPTVNIELFCPGAPTEERKGSYLYQNRHPLELIDYSQLPADISLLSVADALTLPELAEVLRHAKVMYTYEWSMTCVLAVLCGCPVLFIPGYGVDQRFLDSCFFGCVGFAMLDQPEPLERARATLGGGLQRYVERTAAFWQQLDHFIAKTQAAARREAAGNRHGVLDWLRQRYPQPHQLRVLNERLEALAVPTIAILIVDQGNPLALARTLNSLQYSLYEHLHVCVLGNCAPPSDQVQWLQCDPAQPVVAINDWLTGSRSHWFMLVEAGTEFVASGVLMLAMALLEAPAEWSAVYADEAFSGENGVVDLALRPDLNLDLLLASPFSQSRHWLFRRATVVQRNGFDPSTGRSYELDYQLRLLMAEGLTCVGHVSEVLLIAEAERALESVDEQAVIKRHLQERGYPMAQVVALDALPGRYRIDYAHGQAASVSVLVYLEGTLALFQRCLESLLMQDTHAQYQIILIEPGNDDPALLSWLEMVTQLGSAQLEVLRFMPGQSKAAMCNAAAQEACGDFLVWLDAQSVVLDDDWLQVLINQAQRREVGAVGGKVLARDGSVRQAGLVLGLGGSIEPLSHAAGHMKRLDLEQNVVGLSDSLLMLRRDLFLEAGGFDVAPLMAPWADVDLCLRLYQAGYLNVCTPHARILTGGTTQKKPSIEQEDALYERWLPVLARDAAYNRNFSLQSGKGFVAEDNTLSWRPLQGCVPSVLAFSGDDCSVGASRLALPFKALYETGKLGGALIKGVLSAVEIERFDPSSVVLQRPLDDSSLLALRRLRAFSRAFKVYELDGYLPEMGLHAAFETDALMARLRFAVMQADRVLVSTPALAELLDGQHEDIRVLETLLPTTWKNLQSKRLMGAKPRLGWLGGRDSALLTEVVIELASEVEWVVLGDCPDSLRPYLAEWHPQVAQDRLPLALAALNLDLALVPMTETFGNACSGDMRVLQHAACGHPVICSRVIGFTGGEVLPISRVSNQSEDWMRAIRLHLSDPGASALLGDELQVRVRQQWLLEGERLEYWRRAWLAN